MNQNIVEDHLNALNKPTCKELVNIVVFSQPISSYSVLKHQYFSCQPSCKVQKSLQETRQAYHINQTVQKLLKHPQKHSNQLDYHIHVQMASSQVPFLWSVYFICTFSYFIFKYIYSIGHIILFPKKTTLLPLKSMALLGILMDNDNLVI